MVVVALHLLASLLLAVSGWRLGLDRLTAWLAGLLFLINVAHYQCVHHISALDFPLALIFCLGGWLSDRQQRLSGNGWWLAATALCLLLGMASHLGAALLAPLLLLDRWHSGEPWRRAARNVLAIATVFVLGAAALLAITPEDTSTQISLRNAAGDLPAAVVGSLRMYAWMSSRLLTTAHWLPLPLAELSTVELVMGLVFTIGLVRIALRRSQPLAPWAAWTLLGLAPFALISEHLTMGALEGPSHYLYLASAGTSVLLAGALLWGARRMDGLVGRRLAPWGHVIALLIVALIGISSWVSLKRVESISWYNSGRFLLHEDPQAAAEYLRRAIAGGEGVIPMEEAFLRLAVTLPLAGADPFPVLRDGALRFPSSVYLQGGLAVREMESADTLVSNRGRERLARVAEGAQQTGRWALFSTNITALCHNLGLAYERAGRPERAIRSYEHALPYSPEPAATRLRLARAYGQWAVNLAEQGDRQAAAAAQQQAAELSVAP